MVERAAAMGTKLRAGLETLRALPAVGDVRGLGMRAAAERGLILRQRAGAEDPPASGDSLCLAPPLMPPEPVLERIVQILGEAIAAEG